MTRIVTSDDIRSLGTILSIWAHPDDETFCCAGIMSTALTNSQTVVCVTATKGEAGVQDAKRWPPEKLADIRAAELAEALRILGITDHHWLDYPDGGCAGINRRDAVQQITEIIEQYTPDTILTFGPEGMTGHPDHSTVSAWASEAATRSKKPITIYHAVELQSLYDHYLKEADKQFNIYFNIGKPPLAEPEQCDIYYELPKDVCERKCQALLAMPSQTEAMMASVPSDVHTKMFGTETFVLAR